MALAWTLPDPRMTSALVGASSVGQLEANVAALENLYFSPDDLTEIDEYQPRRTSISGPTRARDRLIAR